MKKIIILIILVLLVLVVYVFGKGKNLNTENNEANTFSAQEEKSMVEGVQKPSPPPDIMR